MAELTSTQWMHSCYDVRKDIAILTVKEKIVTINDETNEVLDCKTNLRQFVNPTRKVWITKPEYRKHRYKKESELVSHCNVYTVEDRNLVDFLKEQLDISKFTFTNKRELCNSPYIYGTDISMEALARYRYESNQRHAVTPITIGALDIESSLLHDDHRTNCITVICDKKIYTAALDEFMWKWIGKKKEKATVKDMEEMMYPLIGKWLEEYEFEVIPKVCSNEKELYDFIFGAIQRDEPDYIFIWNLGFDVPQLISRITDLGLDPKKYFCAPSIPENRQYLRYHEDKRPVAHIVQKWNWLHCTSMTQWLDAMALYGQVRKQKPKESSYRLDDIMTNILKVGKLDFDGHSHQYMQEKEFVKYWVYNIFDAMLVQMGCWKTQDCNSLYMLTEHSTLMDFSKQTSMLCNDYHHVLLAEGRVMASTGKQMASPYDNLLSKVGGAVLDAKNVIEMGINCVVERPDRETNVLLFVADDDYSSLYPSWKIACGIAKENKLSTLVEIEGHSPGDIEPLFSAISDPQENAVWLGSTFFGLKNYEEMEAIALEELKKRDDRVPF